jgi:hypothetical protein
MGLTKNQVVLLAAVGDLANDSRAGCADYPGLSKARRYPAKEKRQAVVQPAALLLKLA